MRSVDRRQEIVDAAVAMADEHGVEALSMRNLAERLGMGTMSLYSHVSDKDGAGRCGRSP
jgi:AcrR family transcriptional regulator